MQDVRTPTRVLGPRDDNRQQVAQAKRREKPSALCRTPPTLIRDKSGQSFRRGLCIGEGGFARCFQVNSGDGTLYAAKTIAKATLKSEKTRTKLLGEIKIHRGMKHSNVVQYIDCFEDDVNVYILLEMCANKSLMEMVRQRKQLTETEARFFMVQILGAVNYMHGRYVIHRDLKLGNVFIDSNMNLKIGDFGLAARLDSPLQRRKTVCGTPNYIAPEVLARPHEHTYPTDIWAAGIILFAMLFGKPPFQEKDVNVIYQRIKEHDLVFPQGTGVSKYAVDLIAKMLHADPDRRPRIEEVLSHPWFDGQFPANVPVYALRSVPVFNITPEDSQLNFMTVKLASGLVMNNGIDSRPIEPVTAADVKDHPRHSVLPKSLSPPSTKDKYQMVMVEDNAAAKPVPSYDSPIVDRGQRRRLADDRENQWVPAVRTSTEPNTLPPRPASNTYDSAPRDRKPRPLSAIPSKANPAAMAATAAASYAMRTTTNTSTVRQRPLSVNMTRPKSVSPQNSVVVSRTPSRTSSRTSSDSSSVRDVHKIVSSSAQSTRDNLLNVISAYNNKQLRAGPKENIAKPTYLTKWADFNDVWGLAYGINDGAVGMRFRDNTGMRMDPRSGTFTYFEPSGPNMVIRRLGTRGRPGDEKKIQVLQFAHKYMSERLGHTDPEHGSDDVSDGVFVAHFQRAKGFIMFGLSDGTLQFNFQDHNKLILFNNGENMHLITAQRQEYTLTLAEAVLAADSLPQVGIKQKLEEVVMALSDA